MSRPFVIAVASEKGGVGKTTIATNLAVYLKALREDLPVTIASFDNHFSIDQMFALGSPPEKGVAEMLSGEGPEELAVLGQYGVQYLASSRRLPQPPQPPVWLRRRLSTAVTEGVLILDTRPILDWFTEAALLAADMVLVPIKDRAALVNAAALREVLDEAGCVDHLWLLPSLVDSRARLNAEVRVHEFLSYAARERDYQVLDLVISKSPKVESLASSFSSRIMPVLTHARNTAVHGQFKALAEFVLERFEVAPPAADKAAVELPASHTGHRRLVKECPVCRQYVLEDAGHCFFDQGSRRRGLVHPGCLEQLREELGFDDTDDDAQAWALTVAGPGLLGPECRLSVHRFDLHGNLLGSEEVGVEGRTLLSGFVTVATGRSLNEAYRELVVVDQTARPAAELMQKEMFSTFMQQRRRITRELHGAGLL